MGQISYGTITITDTTDIAEIYMIYGGSINDTDPPTWSYNAVTEGTIWKRNISEITDYDYIWQSTVITKSGINITSDNWTDFYNTPVCITGPEGQGGAPGKGISNIAIQYCNYGTGTPSESYAGWQNTVPSYDNSKPNYWTKTTITYTEGSPFVKIVKDNGITDAMTTANAANTAATNANANATEALNKVQAKYATSSTSAATAAKVATINPAVDSWSLFNGAEIFVKFTNKNTATSNLTLSIKPSSTGTGTTAAGIRDSDGNTLAEKFYWKDNSLVHFVYDGTYWRILDIVTTEKYNNLVTDIGGLSSTVGEHTTSIGSLGTRVGAAETNITQNATSITSLASNQTTYTAPDGSTQTNAIASAISQNATNIDLKVSKNGVIQAINISNEGITIDADKVNITGAAIFTSGRLSENSLNNAYRDAYAISESSGSSSAKTTQSNTPAGFTLYNGATVTIKFNNANTATTPTLNVNGTGAKTIKSYTGAALTAAEYQWPAGAIITFVYDGTYWRMQDEGALQSVAEVAGNLTTEINQRKANYGTSSTSASTRIKVVTCTNFELVDGNELTVYFSTANTQYSNSVQLNVNSKGAKDVWVANAVTSSSNQLLWGAGAYITFKYVTVGSSSYFIVIGEPRSWYGASTTAEDIAAKTDTTAITGCVICKGTKIELAMSKKNTNSSPTLNIRSTGAKSIYYGNTTTGPTAANGHSWIDSTTATFTFDGQYYRMAGQTVINGDNITTGTINSNRIDVAGIITANGIVTNTLTGGTINTNNYIRVSTENLETPISVGLSDEKQDWRVIAGTNFGVDQQGYTYAAELILNNGVTGTNLVNASKLVDKYEKILTVTEENNTNSISTNLSIHQFQENTSDVEEQTQSNYIQTQLNFEPNRLAFTQNIIDNTNSTDITTIEVAHIDATNDGIFYIEKLKPNSVLFGTLELIAYNNGLGIRRRN